MSPFHLLNHLANFLAPALATGLLLALAARFFWGKAARVRAFWAQVAINSIAGGLALAAGLWLLGADGKMASYAVLVLAVASSQWLLLRGWRG